MSAQQTLMLASNVGSRKAVPRVAGATESGRAEGPARRREAKLLENMAFTAQGSDSAGQERRYHGNGKKEIPFTARNYHLRACVIFLDSILKHFLTGDGNRTASWFVDVSTG